MTKRVSLEQKAEMRRLHADGWTFARIGERLAFQGETVRRAIDPIYAEVRREQINDARQFRRQGGRSPKAGRPAAMSIDIRLDAAARLAEVPADTRSLTQRICGDPLPGRDALSKASNGAEP